MMTVLRWWKLACTAAVSILIVSCGGGADYRDLLPADSFMTLSVDPASLVEKSGVGDIAKTPLFAQLKTRIEAAEELTAEEKAYLLELLQNPAEAGIDPTKNVFMFLTVKAISANPDAGGGVLLAVSDRARLDDLIARVNAKSGTETQTEGGVSLVRIGEQNGVEVVFAYNDVACLLYFMSNPYADIAGKVRTLFAQKRSESLMGNSEIARRLSARNDVGVVVSYAGIAATMMANPLLRGMPIIDLLKEMTVVSSLNFEKGRIVSEAEIVYPNSQIEAQIKESYAYIVPQKGALLRYLPAGSVLMVSYGLDGQKMYPILAELPGYGALMSNPMARQAVEAFDGDLAVSFTGMTDDGRYPLMSLLAEVDDPDLLETVVGNLAGLPVNRTGEGEYSFTMDGLTLLFGEKKGVLYCTTDPAVKSALDGQGIESLTSLEGIVKDRIGSLYLDLGGVEGLVQRMYGGDFTPQMRAVMSVLGLFDDMQASATMQGGTLEVRMADREQNAFKSICDLTAELVRQYGSGADM